MRLSKLGGKEIVNLNDGGRLGIIDNSDIMIDIKSGKINSFLIPEKNQFKIFGDREELQIPWDSIKKIGEDMMIVEFNRDNRKR